MMRTQSLPDRNAGPGLGRPGRPGSTRLLARAFALALILVLPGLRAQGCSYNPQFQSYGAGCNTAFGTAPTITGSFDPGTCAVTLTAGVFPGCCNTYLQQRWLLLGLAPDQSPVPQYPGCTLLVQPDLLVTPWTPNPMVFPLPPGLPPVTVFAQGGFVYFTTIGFTYDLALTAGLAVTLS
jgi:hypothetical protein